MTRRNVLSTMLPLAVLSQKDTTTAFSTLKLPEPMTLSFNLRAFKDYKFTLGDRAVTLTPEQVMDALTEQPKEAQPSTDQPKTEASR